MVEPSKKDHLLAMPTVDINGGEFESYTLPYNRKKVLFAALFSLLTTQTLFLNVENILPTYVEDNHSDLTEIHIALVLR